MGLNKSHIAVGSICLAAGSIAGGALVATFGPKAQPAEVTVQPAEVTVEPAEVTVEPAQVNVTVTPDISLTLTNEQIEFFASLVDNPLELSIALTEEELAILSRGNGRLEHLKGFFQDFAQKVTRGYQEHENAAPGNMDDRFKINCDLEFGDVNDNAPPQEPRLEA